MVAYGGQYARGGGQGAYSLSDMDINGQRFLHEERDPRGKDSGLGFSVREGGHADVHRVNSGAQQLGGAGK